MLGVEVQLSAYTKACYGGVAVKTRRVSMNKVRYKRAGSCQARYGHGVDPITGLPASTARVRRGARRPAVRSSAVRGGLHYLRDSRAGRVAGRRGGALAGAPRRSWLRHGGCAVTIKSDTSTIVIRYKIDDHDHG